MTEPVEAADSEEESVDSEASAKPEPEPEEQPEESPAEAEEAPGDRLAQTRRELADLDDLDV